MGDSRIVASFESWVPWTDPQNGIDLVKIIKHYPVLGESELRYGPSDSRTFKFDELTPEKFSKWWTQVGGGHFKLGKPWKFQITIMYFNFLGRRVSNWMWVFIEQDFFSEIDRGASFFSFCKELYSWGKIDCGSISTRQENDIKKNVGLLKQPRGPNLGYGLPGVYWANFIGPRYVNWIGEEKFKSLKTYSKEKLDDGGWFFTTREDVNKYDMYEMLRDEERIVNHLGKIPFFERIKIDD